MTLEIIEVNDIGWLLRGQVRLPLLKIGVTYTFFQLSGIVPVSNDS